MMLHLQVHQVRDLDGAELNTQAIVGRHVLQARALQGQQIVGLGSSW